MQSPSTKPRLSIKHVPQRGSALIAALAIAVILLLLIATLLPSAMNSESSGVSSVVQSDLRLAAEAALAIQSAQLVTNNDHRANTFELDATPPSLVADASRLPQKQVLETAVVEIKFDSPCNLCGINNEQIYANNVPARNVIFELDACARRRATLNDETELGRHCRTSQVQLFPWSNDGGSRALAEDNVTFPLP